MYLEPVVPTQIQVPFTTLLHTGVIHHCHGYNLKNSIGQTAAKNKNNCSTIMNNGNLNNMLSFSQLKKAVCVLFHVDTKSGVSSSKPISHVSKTKSNSICVIFLWHGLPHC